jgi:hypothetical protein
LGPHKGSIGIKSALLGGYFGLNFYMFNSAKPFDDLSFLDIVDIKN